MKKILVYNIIPVFTFLLIFLSCSDVGRDNPYDPKAGGSPGYPVADFTVNGGAATALQNQPAVFLAVNSSDSQDGDFRYRWYFQNEGQWLEWSASPLSYRTYTASGSENVILEIKNEAGMTDSIEKTIHIIDSNPPNASFEYAPDNPCIGNIITFNASSSTDDDSSALELKAQWDFDNDGVFDTDWTSDKTVTHTFNSSGNKTVRVAIKDRYGLVTTTECVISILSTPAYTVTYNSNGATQGEIPVDSSNYQQGETVTVAGNTGTLVKTGYEFEGWNTKSDGSGGTFAAGTVFTMGSANVTLYAKWSEPVVWKSGAMLVDGRSGHASVCLNDKIFIIGGTESAFSILNTVLAYDPLNGSLTTRAPLQISRTYLAAEIVNTKIYAFGGRSENGAESTIEEYDPSLNTWTLKSSVTSTRGRFLLASAVYGGKIYFFGGRSSSSEYPRSYVDEYNPDTDTWNIKSDMPTPRSGATASVVNGKIYVIGGGIIDGGDIVSSNVVEVFDPATNTWSTAEEMPTARHYISSIASNNRIFVFGGLKDEVLKNPVALNTVEVYDISYETWNSKASMITERYLLTSVLYNDMVYTIGGTHYTDSISGRREVEIYNPLADSGTSSIFSGMWSYYWQTYKEICSIFKKFVAGLFN